MTSTRDEWATPPSVFKRIQTALGITFDLDVCASAGNAKCERYYTKADNGLTQPWANFNWCNPPYSRGSKEDWFAKAVEECHKYSNITAILTDYCVDTQWYARWRRDCSHIYLLDKRIQFIPPKGIWASSNNKGSMLSVISPKKAPPYEIHILSLSHPPNRSS